MKTKTIVKAVALLVGGVTLVTLFSQHPVQVVLVAVSTAAYMFSSNVAEKV